MTDFRPSLPPEMLLLSDEELKQAALENPHLAELLLKFEEEDLPFEELLIKRFSGSEVGPVGGGPVDPPGPNFPPNLQGPVGPPTGDGGTRPAPVGVPLSAPGPVGRPTPTFGRLARLLLDAGAFGPDQAARKRRRRRGGMAPSKGNKITRPPGPPL